MSSQSGRKLILKRDGTVIAGLRTKSMTVNNEPIDVTTDDDDGFRTLLEDSATKSIDISFDGLTKDETLIEHAVTGSGLIEEYTIEFPYGGSIASDFRLNNLEISGEHEDAVEFSGELQSTGEFTYTPDPS